MVVSASGSGCFNPELNWVKGQVDPRAGLDLVAMKKVILVRNQTAVFQTLASPVIMRQSVTLK